jgi:uncharacterized protein (TIGR02611 family)
MTTEPEDRPTPALQDRDDVPELVLKLQERKERQKQRSKLYRAGTVVVGLLLLLVGIFLSGPGIPGPGFLVILLGLGLLALEFERAERLLEKVIVWADQAKDRANRASGREKVLAGLLVALVVGALVAAAILWDIPLLPV